MEGKTSDSDGVVWGEIELEVVMREEFWVIVEKRIKSR